MKFISSTANTNWFALATIAVVALLVGSTLLWFAVLQRESGVPPAEVDLSDDVEDADKQEDQIAGVFLKDLKEGKNQIGDIIVERLLSARPGERGIYDIGGEKTFSYEGIDFKFQASERILEGKHSPTLIYGTLSVLDEPLETWKKLLEFENLTRGLDIFGYRDNVIIIARSGIDIGELYTAFTVGIVGLSLITTDKIVSDERVVYDYISYFPNAQDELFSFPEIPLERGPYPDGYSCQSDFNFYCRVGPISFLEKDNELYIKIEKNYCYGGGELWESCVDEYYQVGEGKLLQSNKVFKDEYLKAIAFADRTLESSEKDWLIGSALISRTLQYIFIGEEEKAWDDFDALFSTYVPDFSSETIKQAINEELSQRKFEQQQKEEQSRSEEEIDTSDPVLNEVEGWQTYRNEEFGFEVRYPGDHAPIVSVNTAQIQRGEGESWGDLLVYLYEDTTKFDWYLNDGVSSHPLKYEKTQRQWHVMPFEGSLVHAFCPSELKTELQQLPYYQIGDPRSGRLHDFAFVTDRGIIVLSMGDFEPMVLKRFVHFDDPKNVIKVSCNIR